MSLRKVRKTITLEIFNLIKDMMSSETNTTVSIARSLNLSRNTVSGIIKKIQSGEEFEDAKSKLKRTLRLKRGRARPENEIISNCIAVRNDITLKEIKARIGADAGLNISTSTISRRMKNLNVTRKRLSLLPEERNCERVIRERRIYSTHISNYNPENLVFLDETGFNLHTHRTYGYSFKNTKAYFKAKANRGVNVS